MSLTHVIVSVSPLTKPDERIEAKFLVDTGAIDCLMPASILKRAGIEPEETDIYELADGQRIKFPVGVVRISFMGAHTVVKIIFGPEDAEPILGVVALESAGFAVDPVGKTLRRLQVRSLKKVA